MDLAAGTASPKPRGDSTPGPHPLASASESDPFTPLERAVRLFVYDHFVKTTKAPDLATIAAAVKRTPDAVTSALKRLAELRALVLAPATVNIWMAHPFSAVPTRVSGRDCGPHLLGELRVGCRGSAVARRR